MHFFFVNTEVALFFDHGIYSFKLVLFNIAVTKEQSIGWRMTGTEYYDMDTTVLSLSERV
jgi:hypothetical protein